VEKCPSCGIDIQEGRPFCSACGRVPKAISGLSYGPTWLFLIVAVLGVLFWAGIRNSQIGATPIPVPTPAPDDAAVLVQRCGKADGDFVAPGKSDKEPERRWLLYNSGKVRTAFERDSQRPDSWKKIGYFDAASKKPLTAKQVLKRLPCAESGSQF